SLPIPAYWGRCKVCGEYKNRAEEFICLGKGKLAPIFCPKDGGPYEEARGFGCFKNGVEEVITSFRFITGTAVDIEKFTIEKGKLYTLMAVSEGQRFRSHISIFPQVGAREFFVEDAKKVLEYAKQLNEEGIGGGKTRGLGHVKVKAELLQVDDNALKREVKAMTRDLRKSTEKFGSPKVALWLISPLPTEKAGKMEPGVLAGYLRRAQAIIFRPPFQFNPEVVIETALFKQTTVGGFSLYGRPKHMYSALDGGSAALISVKDDEKMGECLSALNHVNSGKYKSYGCGEIKAEVIF
ncbi:MAG: hypothetical protein ACP5PX_07335, partial [Candidatus Hadarchaeum sp.]|uniref:hypothetical protein n=1 Tax=Candidatus Hadarchaeum sp. TaxID=2883567 RepID=UPI003D0DFEB2